MVSKRYSGDDCGLGDPAVENILNQNEKSKPVSSFSSFMRSWSTLKPSQTLSAACKLNTPRLVCLVTESPFLMLKKSSSFSFYYESIQVQMFTYLATDFALLRWKCIAIIHRMLFGYLVEAFNYSMLSSR
ncbi:hypothetical protein ACJMK2_042557 [Sinanodonta woodiana]|uniref:Uncharacterized protein n=1 Tax=Sinanodonta woodiana TaxID=1069815 RepID=A0ABD3W971_SINWO